MHYRKLRGVCAALAVILSVPAYAPASHPRQVNFCKLFGAVYLEKDPRQADFKVYLEESKAFSDIIIYKAEDRLFADREGLWHFTDKKAFADFSIAFEKKRGLADFSIYFTETESFARCND
jgi:hypothetical protein